MITYCAGHASSGALPLLELRRHRRRLHIRGTPARIRWPLNIWYIWHYASEWRQFSSFAQTPWFALISLLLIIMSPALQCLSSRGCLDIVGHLSLAEPSFMVHTYRFKLSTLSYHYIYILLSEYACFWGYKDYARKRVDFSFQRTPFHYITFII